MKRTELKNIDVGQKSAPPSETYLTSVLYDAEIMRNLLNVLADGDGLASNQRISALALASLKCLDDMEGAVNAALSQPAELCPNEPSVINYVLCDCID